jgi:hypothetical protein
MLGWKSWAVGGLVDVVGLARTDSQRRPRCQEEELTDAETKIVFGYQGRGERQREREKSRYHAYCPRCVLRYCSILPFDRAWLSCREADRTSQQHHGSNAALITVCRQQVCTKLLFASLFSTRLQNKGPLCDIRTGYTKPVSIEMDLADFVLALGLNRPLTTRQSQVLPYMP